MKLNSNKHTAQYVKRLAKKIKKEQNIPHHQALDKAAQSIGFSNWKHFLNEAEKVVSTSTPINNTQSKPSGTSKKRDPYRNLLVEAINVLVENNHISLDLDEVDEYNEFGYVFHELFGYNSVISWSNIGLGELRISVWWKYNHGKHPQANLEGRAREKFLSTEPLAKRSHYRKFVGVVASCWLERDTGKYIQGKKRRGIFNTYTRKGELEALRKLKTAIPKGYKDSGRPR